MDSSFKDALKRTAFRINKPKGREAPEPGMILVAFRVPLEVKERFDQAIDKSGDKKQTIFRRLMERYIDEVGNEETRRIKKDDEKS